MFAIRPMTSRDVPRMMVVNRQCFTRPWSAFTIRSDIDYNQNSHWMLLETDDETPVSPLHRLWRLFATQPGNERHVVGFAAFWLMEREAHITSIGVGMVYRGNGLGELLLASLLAYAMGVGARFSSLEVRVSNQRAIQLYHKYGYQITGRRKGYYHDNNEDAHIMETPLFDSTYQALLQERLTALAERLAWKDELNSKAVY